MVRLSSVRPSVVVVVVVVYNGCIVAKQREIGLRLLLIINRKSHIGFQMTWKSMTLNDLTYYDMPIVR